MIGTVSLNLVCNTGDRGPEGRQAEFCGGIQPSSFTREEDGDRDGDFRAKNEPSSFTREEDGDRDCDFRAKNEPGGGEILSDSLPADLPAVFSAGLAHQDSAGPTCKGAPSHFSSAEMLTNRGKSGGSLPSVKANPRTVMGF